MSIQNIIVCILVLMLAGIVVSQQSWGAPDLEKYPGNKPIPHCWPGQEGQCWRPPWYPYDQIHRRVRDTGTVIGRSMEVGPTIGRYVNIFLGVPYARPPVGERRFKPPERPGPNWDQSDPYWDASFYRPACPQEIWQLQPKLYEMRNVSEDCLYMNIFSPNLTDRIPSRNRNYQILVFVHGEDFKLGDAHLYPGHLLAMKEVLVVTFNYRMGALGFLSTGDRFAPGNYGLRDVIEVLKFIQTNAYEFRGDRDQVTLVGHGSGAAIVSLLTLSPLARGLFHRVIAMSGTDMCDWSMSGNIWYPKEYAMLLGRKVGCDPDYTSIANMVECLRYKSDEELVNGTAQIPRMYGSMGGPFAPVVDGAGGVIPDQPKNLRRDGKIMDIRFMAGLTKDEGAYIAKNWTKDILGLDMAIGMDPGTLRELMVQMVQERFTRNVQEIVNAMEFEYTYWPKPDNKTAVVQNYINMWTDYVWGSCIDSTLKSQAAGNEPVYMYTFNYRSEYEVLPYWMGVPHGRDVDYLFGHPFFNETLGNITGVVPDQASWTYLDKNISVFMQDMWLNFTKYGIPTMGLTEWTRNVTWFPYSPRNLSFLHVAEWSRMEINYRQNHYAFWRDFFPRMLNRWPLTTTMRPTPKPLMEYQMATFSLMAVAIIIMIVLAAMGITLWRRGRTEGIY